MYEIFTAARCTINELNYSLKDLVLIFGDSSTKQLITK